MATVTDPNNICYGMTAAQVAQVKGLVVEANMQRAEVQAATGGGMILTGSINGQQVSYTFDRRFSVQEMAMHVAAAEAELAGETLPRRDRAQIAFT